MVVIPFPIQKLGVLAIINFDARYNQDGEKWPDGSQPANWAAEMRRNSTLQGMHPGMACGVVLPDAKPILFANEW